MGISTTILTSAALLAAGVSQSPYNMPVEQLTKATPERFALYWFDYVLNVAADKAPTWQTVAEVAASYATLKTNLGLKKGFEVLAGTCTRKGFKPYPLLFIKLDDSPQVYGAAAGTYNRLYTVEQLQCAHVTMQGQF